MSAHPRDSSPEWQPIETAPKNGTYILVTNDEAKVSWIAKFVGEQAFIENPWMSMMLNLWHSPVRYFSSVPLYWMPLPEPPADEAETLADATKRRITMTDEPTSGVERGNLPDDISGFREHLRRRAALSQPAGGEG